MAAEDVIERWTVLIDHEDEGKVRTYKLPSTMTVEELKARWGGDVDVPPDAFLFVTTEDAVVPNTHSLEQIGETSRGRKNIVLNVEETVNIFVKMFRSEEERVRMQVRLSAPPEELEEAVRAEFRIPRERNLRLRTGMELLTPGVALVAQGVAAESLVEVELLYEVAVRDPRSGIVEQYLILGSDPSALPLDDAGGPQRLMSGRQTVGGLAQASYSMWREVRQYVTVAANGLLKTYAVWPLDRVKRLLPACAQAPAQAAVVFDSVLLSWSTRLCSVNLPSSSLVYCAPLSVHVRTSNGKIHVVNVPGLGCVSDVKEAVRGKEPATHFVLRCRGRELEEEESLAGAGVSSGDLLEVEPTGLALTVTLCDRAVRWRTHRRSLRYRELMKEVSYWGSVKYKQLLGRTLCCTGCGRRVWMEEEAFQAVPATCCSVRSLDLAEPTKKDGETQTACRREARSVETKPEQQSVDRDTQAVAFWHQAGTQTEGASRATAGDHRPLERRCFGQQHPPPPAPKPFLILYYAGGRRHDISTDLQLPDRPTVGEVRVAVEQAVGAEPGSVKLKRSVATVNGKEVFVVCDRNDSFFPDFVDESGVVWGWMKVENRRRRPLTDDTEHFPLAQEKKNTVIAEHT